MYGITLIFIAIGNTLALYVLSKGPQALLATPIFLLLNQVSALLGALLLAISFILTTRSSLLEKLFNNTDKVYHVHHITGAIAFMFLLNHPIFLIVSALPNFKLATSYIIPSLQNLPYFFGIAALWVMILLLVLTLFIQLPYHVWKQTHEYLGITLLLGLFHVFTITSDVSRFLPLRLWMLGMLVLAAISYLYIRFLYKVIGPKTLGEVVAIQRIGDILNIVIHPIGKKFKFVPGQFVFLSTSNPRVGSELHPFSISSIPAEENVRLSIRIEGDYTLRLRELRQGDTVVLHGPHGRFGERFENAPQVLCIGGGIGITPILSMVRYRAHHLNSSQQIVCYYSVSNKDEAVFHDELVQCSQNNLAISYCMYESRKEGRLTAKKIINTLNFSLDKLYVYLCGPTAMMESLADQFVQLGIRKSRIIYENFALK